MNDEEHLIAEQVVAVHDQHPLTVRISQNPSEEFWRVDVTNPSVATGHITATVAPGDSFLMNLIEDAVNGKPVAWKHLAQWGHTSIARQPGGARSVFV